MDVADGCFSGTQHALSPPRTSSGVRVARWYPFSYVNSAGRHVASEGPDENQPPSSPGAMFFKQHDILQEIFSYFRREEYSAGQRRELLAFMLINKSTFHFPARLLWSRIGDKIFYVLRLLELDVWDRSLPRASFGETFLRSLQRNLWRICSNIMWRKFLYYADAVESLHINTITLYPQTIELLTGLLPPDDPIIFRSLRHLLWAESYAHSNDMLYMLCPSLEDLQVSVFDFGDSQFSSFDFSDWLERILYSGSHLSHHVKRFSIKAAGALILHPSVLYDLRSLQLLTITQTMLSHTVDDEIVAPPTAFNALKELEIITNYSYTSVLDSLQYITPFITNSLLQIDIHSFGIASVRPGPTVNCFLDQFDTLLRMHQLLEIRLNFVHHDFVFTDDDLVTVAKAWPKAIEIGFAFRSMERTPIPHLETIGVVAGLCPSLQRITVPALSGPGANIDFRISAPHSHPLEEIRTQSMTWDALHNLAITNGLKQTFPKLIIFEGLEGEEEYLRAILEPYILCSKISGYPITKIPRDII